MERLSLAFVLLLLQQLLLLTASSSSSSWASAMLPPDPASVTVVNDMQGQTVGVNCWMVGDSHDSDQQLLYGQVLEWGFTPTSWGSTAARCTFHWNARTQDLEVRHDERERPVRCRLCTHCIWTIKEDGFYFSEAGHSGLVFYSPWK